MKNTGKKMNPDEIYDQITNAKRDSKEQAEEQKAQQEYEEAQKQAEETVDMSDFEKNKFGVVIDEHEQPKKKGHVKQKKDKKETASQGMKSRMKKEKKKENRIKLRYKLRGVLTNANTYAGILKIMDFLLNTASLLAIGVAVFYSLKFLIEQNPIMALTGCLVVWLLIKLNEKIQ